MTRTTRLILIVEFLLLCGVLPSVIIAFRLAPFLFAFLWAAVLYAGIVTYRSAGGPDFLRQM